MRTAICALFAALALSCINDEGDLSEVDDGGTGGSGTGGSGTGGSGTGGSAGATAGGSGGSRTDAAAGSDGGPADAPAPNGPVGPAALATKLGFSSQTFGFGYDAGIDPFTGEFALGVPIQILDRYMSGMSTNGGWTTWNPNGSYTNEVFDFAKSGGAVPMFTLYQMIAFGGANGGLDCLNDTACMTEYWAELKNMMTRIGSYDAPAMLNVEPDLSGYAQSVAQNRDPATVPVKTALASECSGLSGDLIGYADCILRLRDQLAPKLMVGFNPSTWLGANQAIQFMTKMGAGKGDFLVMQTLDRDVGCFEIQDAAGECNNGRTAPYWGDTEFRAHIAEVKSWYNALHLPIVWWQTPFGVPSDTPGRNTRAAYGYRDNRMQYFFENVVELVNAGGLAVIFGQGQGKQADISTDILPDGTHQYKGYLDKYAAAPVPIR
jgi:hypothetical protein